MKNILTLTICLLTIVAMLFGCQKTDETMVTPAVTPGGTASTQLTPLVTQAQTGETHIIDFLSVDEQILDRQNVTDGCTAVPPEAPLVPGLVFEKWDTKIENIKADKTIKPVYTDVSETNNAIALSGAYVSFGEKVSVALTLCGVVELCGLDIVITYDPVQLKFIEFKEPDGDVVTNCDNNGTIYLNFVSVNNAEGDIDLCGIIFEAIGDTSEATLALFAKKVIKINDMGDIVNAEYKLINSKVYIYEVD